MLTVGRRRIGIQFGQIDELTQILLNTGDKELIEASPNDRIVSISQAANQAWKTYIQFMGLTSTGTCNFRSGASGTMRKTQRATKHRGERTNLEKL